MTKEEKKDEMKNRISMALKDPILQQGFEIICKNLAELEKENAELKADNDARKYAMAMSEKVEKQLRKENAELTKDRDYYSDAIDKQFEATLKLHKECEELNEGIKKLKDEWQEQVQKAIDEGYARTQQTIQLTKAKELLKNIIRVTWGEGWNYSLDWKIKAEQFLKEIEK